MTMGSTLREINDPMNSFKSASSFAKFTPVPFYQLEEDVEAFLGREVRVELVVRLFSIVKTAEHLNDALHGNDFSMADAEYHRS